jgi:hypothetical protein
MLHDHDLMVAMMPAMVTMHFGAGAETFVVATAFLDHNLLGTCNRRRRYGHRANGGNNVSKLLHLLSSSFKARIEPDTNGNVPREPEENSEQAFSNHERLSVQQLLAVLARYSTIAE